MDGKKVISIFIVVIIGIFVYHKYFLQPTAIINPIDTNEDYKDYKLLENTDIDSYVVFGQIEEINTNELKIRTSSRILTIKKPKATEYFALPNVPIDETQLQKDDEVSATFNVDKSTNEVVKLSITVLVIYGSEGIFE